MYASALRGAIASWRAAQSCRSAARTLLRSTAETFSRKHGRAALRTSALFHQKPQAVIFDVGGVVIPSPFPLIARFEARHNLKAGSVSATIRHFGKSGAFGRLETGRLTLEGFCAPFAKEYSELHGVQITESQVWELATSLGGLDVQLLPYQEVVDLLGRLRLLGIKTALLTNNFKFDSGKTVMPHQPLDVDVVVQSCVEGVSKPDPAIFAVVLEKLGVAAEEAVFLDDLGANLKPAREMGMTTVKVTDYREAIKEVEQLVAGTDGEEIPGTTLVSPKLALPVDRLATYLQEHHGLSQEGPPSIRLFRHGQSNPTYYVAYGREKMVLRKKPPGKLLPSAHAIEREFRVMEAVALAGVPVPGLLSLCEDSSVVGTPFYLMSYVPGHLLKDPSLPLLQPPQRKAVYEEMYRVLAAIHSVDVDEVQLADFGKKGNYVKRQVDRWSRQYQASTTHSMPSMDRLMEWLPQQPLSSERTTLVHGDFRLDNLIFDLNDLTVQAVLDWELSTLGDPLSDLAYCCLSYHLEPDTPSLKGLRGLDIASLGIPSEEEMISLYCKLTGTPAIHNWNFYMAFCFFRVAAILQGVYKRALQQQSSSDDGRAVGMMAEDFANKGWALAQGSKGKGGWGAATGNSQRRQLSTSAGMHLQVASGFIFDDCAFLSPRVRKMREELEVFLNKDIIPNEPSFREHQSSTDRWTPHPLLEKLKEKARSQGLWNLFLPVESDPGSRYGAGLTNLEYAHLSEIMGRSPYASEVFNCSPPDTGNMEVLVRYGSEEQKQKWLLPLLAGEIRSCFAMTEPNVASSDATNIESEISHHGSHYVINGRKWWISGAMDSRCKICIFMGKTDPSAPKHKQQSMVLVPMDTPGVRVLRPLTVFGYDDAPEGHAEIDFTNVQVPVDSILLGEGRGFEIAQGRLGPGRIHHCMRLIGMAERALSLTTERVQERFAFGRPLASFDTVLSDIAHSRMEIDQARLLTLKAAHMMDTVGNKEARREIAMIKVVAPRMAQSVIDRAIQAHGALGLSSDSPLAQFFAWARILRIADGPDEVHVSAVGKMELRKKKTSSV